MNGEIKVYRLSEVRTSSVLAEPENVVLTIRASGEVRHYEMKVFELSKLARQLSLDATLLSRITTPTS